MLLNLLKVKQSYPVALISILPLLFWDFLVAELVKIPPAMQETPVQFLGWEDPLEKGQATYSSILGLPWWLSW